MAAIALCSSAFAQAQKPGEKSESKPAPTEKNAAQIELLETKYRFETNGDSRKEVHALVRINNELGVQQFRSLKFDFNRKFQAVEIPLVRVTHASGGTADVLPSAIADNPNPAVVDFPAYHDVRVKSVRILGLAPGDLLEYRVITTTTKPPLAPDFWLDHSFDRTGVVTEEHFELDLPESVLASLAPTVVTGTQQMKDLELGLLAETIEPHREIQIIVGETASTVTRLQSGRGNAARTRFLWARQQALEQADQVKLAPELRDLPDIEVGRSATWASLSLALFKLQTPPSPLSGEVTTLAAKLTEQRNTPAEKAEGIYNFVSQKVRTVDLALGATGFKTRAPGDVLSSGYGSPEDKAVLFQALSRAAGVTTIANMVAESSRITRVIASPTAFTRVAVYVPAASRWADPALEVAPFGALPATERGNASLALSSEDGTSDNRPIPSALGQTPRDLPFPSIQRVNLRATLDESGKLTAKVEYTMRGDNELLLRVAFHQTPKEKWKDVAQLLALSDGFRGQVTNVTASDPYDTKDPFQVEYEVTQPKFVNWDKKPVRIPAILPLVGLPDPPAAGAATIDLGTPLEVNLSATITLPTGTTAKAPPATSVSRDYAEFSSSYSANANTITASRKIHFLLRSIPSARAMDYNAFLRAVQNDQAQDFTLENGPAGATPKSSPPATTRTGLP